MKKAFVAGATGYTGHEVVRQLAARGVEVIAHVRPDSRSLDSWRARFGAMNVVVDTTPWHPDAIEQAIRTHQPDAVFSLLGTTRARARRAASAGESPADYQTVDYGMTHMLLDAVRKASPTARFIYLSAIGATQDTRNEYLRVRGIVERELSESGIRWSAARPLFISGPDREERRPTERIATVATDALLGLVGLLGGRAARDRFRSITAERLARALISAAEDEKAVNRVIDAAELQRRADET